MTKTQTPLQATQHLDFQPFKAWRYNTDRVKASAVLAPPYDVISPEKQQKLYENSPFNCIRLILNKKDPKDTDQNNAYTRARDLFQEWQKQGVLIQESEPCFYVYRQTFKDPVTRTTKNRFALLGRVRLQPFEKEIIVPHEKTLRGPKEDRMRLLRTVKTNFSPVFGLYKDKGFEIRSIIQDPMNSNPLFEAEDDDKVVHTLWVLEDPDILARLHKALQPKKVYIADGHHRYETALEYARQMREEKHLSETVLFPFDYMYMALVSFDDPGFIVLPTHRIVTRLGMTGNEAMTRLKEYFKVEKVSLDRLKEMTASYDQEGNVFGLVLPEGCFLLTMIDKKKAKERMVQGKPGVWYDLNVNVLAHLIFELLELTEDRWESVLKFEHTVDGAVVPLQKGEAEAVFLLQPPKVEMLEKMGAVNERMPQKSTYFYPKLATGLVFYSHKE
ncbi:MAG TPA: DUF1015 domain-containing protein [Candidatus Omnitrophota bacterium]|nr:DUF1015 domain-containing protein [Candidatus Omnitrophota bacterium]